MFRDICGGGGKGGGSSYDPQIGAAAKSTAATAAAAQAFSENYYNTVITPLIKQQSAASLESQARLNHMYDLNSEQMQTSIDRYNQYGIPAEEKYYQMANQYSEPEEYERQATAAKGDVGTALANQRGSMMRQFSALGIDPTSGAAVGAMNNQALTGAGIEAAAMNRARNSARTLGMQLTADAANFGRGGQSGIINFGNSAAGNATGSFGVANQALQTGSTAGNMVNQGYNTAMQGYSNIMNNYAQLGSAQIQANASSGSSGLAGLGQLAGIGLSFIPGFGMSDIRTKKNLLHVDTLHNGVKVYQFEFKDEFKDEHGHGTQVGVIAQELARIIPSAVHVGNDGYLRVDYRKLR